MVNPIACPKCPGHSSRTNQPASLSLIITFSLFGSPSLDRGFSLTHSTTGTKILRYQFKNIFTRGLTSYFADDGLSHLKARERWTTVDY